MVFENGVKNLQAAAYNGARTVCSLWSVYVAAAGDLPMQQVSGKRTKLAVFPAKHKVSLGLKIPMIRVTCQKTRRNVKYWIFNEYLEDLLLIHH